MADIVSMMEFWSQMFDGPIDGTPSNLQAPITFALPSGVTVIQVQQLISIASIHDNTGVAFQEVDALKATLEYNGGVQGQQDGITGPTPIRWLAVGSQGRMGACAFYGDQNPTTAIEALSGQLIARWNGVEITGAAPVGTMRIQGVQFGVRIWFTQSITEAADWTSGEKENIRQALGVTGTKSATSGGNLDDVLDDTDEIQGKLPSKATLRGTADADGGFDTEDKADIEAECEDALADYTAPTKAELDAAEAAIIAEVDANEVKIDNLDADLVTHDTDIKALIGTPVADIATDIATNLTAITSIQNNTRFTSAIPEQMQKPDSSSTAFRWTGNLYDTDGNMEDPVNNEILVRVLQADGTPITANLYKEQALTNPLDNATDQGNFPSGSGWRAMERLGVGQYDLFYKVASTETEEALTVEFGWDEASVIMSQYRATAVVDYAGDIEDIQAKVDAMYIKTDAVTPSPTIPAQITTHDTDNKALARVEADVPKYMVVPAARSVIDIVGGITAIDTEVPITNASDFPTDGIVIIESEYIIYAGITDNKLQVTDRGAYGSGATTHANGVQVYEVKNYTLRLIVYDNEGNMTNADSLPTIEIIDWDGNQELAPTSMTAIRTGVYGYNYLVPQTDIAENKVFKFSAVKNTNTFDRPVLVILLNTPTEEVLSNQLAGGNGDFVLDQDGWYDVNGNLTLWTDTNKGVVTDAVTGAPLDDAWITAFPVVNGETQYSGRPTAQSQTKPDGSWKMFLDAGTYTFVFEKEGFTIVGDNVVNRTVNP